MKQYVIRSGNEAGKGGYLWEFERNYDRSGMASSWPGKTPEWKSSWGGAGGALRFTDRPQAYRTADRAGGRVVLLVPKSKPPKCVSCSGSGKLVRIGHGFIICPTCKGRGHLGVPESRGES